MTEEAPQTCLCSLGVEGCPAHPFRKRRIKAKPNAGEIRAANCAACKGLGVREHDGNRHRLGGYKDISAALRLGTVYCSLEKYGNRPMVVRDAMTDGGLYLQVLEGWQSGPFTEIWMEAKANK